MYMSITVIRSLTTKSAPLKEKKCILDHVNDFISKYFSDTYICFMKCTNIY